MVQGRKKKSSLSPPLLVSSNFSLALCGEGGAPEIWAGRTEALKKYTCSQIWKGAENSPDGERKCNNTTNSETQALKTVPGIVLSIASFPHKKASFLLKKDFF